MTACGDGSPGAREDKEVDSPPDYLTRGAARQQTLSVFPLSRTIFI